MSPMTKRQIIYEAYSRTEPEPHDAFEAMYERFARADGRQPGGPVPSTWELSPMLRPAHPARGPRHHVQRLHAAAGVPTLGLPSCRVGARTLRALVSGWVRLGPQRHPELGPDAGHPADGAGGGQLHHVLTSAPIPTASISQALGGTVSAEHLLSRSHQRGIDILARVT